MSLPVKANFQLLNTPTDSNSLPSSKEDVNGIKSGKYTEYLCHGESEASSLVSSFYSNLGLTVRVVDVKKILAERTESNANTIQFRPFSCLFPGSKRVVVSPVSDLNEFAALLDLDGLVTVHKPIDDSVMEWAFKWDADTGQNGEARKKKSKKITDFATLKKKVEEMEWRDESLFPSWCSSGHLSPDGYSLHHSSLPKGVGNLNYPEIICRYNFDQTHCGYLLDFRREKSFFQIARFMENILRLETHGCAGQRPKPITLFLYDSYRGRLLSPLELDRTLVNKIADNVKVFARYARFSHQERELYNLLSQAGCDRFLRLLMNNIPESVRAVANAGQTIDVENIKKAIVNLEVSKVLAMLSEIDNELIARVGLPTTLMDQLIDHPIFTDKDFKNYHKSANNKHYLQYFDRDRLRRLMRTTFAAQGDICRALIKNNLFIPFIARGVYEPMVNPLVCCLLIANGSRTNFTESCFDVTTSLFPIMAAREFYREGLLTGAELKIIRHETLWQIVFDYPRNVITDPDKLIERFRKLVNTLSGFLAQHKQKSHPDDWVKQECREILSEPLYTIYLDEKASGVDLKKALEEGLSAQRYNDRQLMDYICFTIFSATGSCDDDLALIKFQNGYSFIPKCWVVNRFSTKDSSPDHWLEALLASPPIFDPREMQRAGRYRTITREAGQHYYQNPHPGLAKNILARGIKPRYRECHGLDHALRTQLATEFLLEILTDFHPPFKELLKQHQLLQELLPIAELYHDAVAEVEAKEHEELRAAELFERDMMALQQYPEPLITLVADALRNKNSNKMHPVPEPFTADDQCPEDELLLRQVLRFGDTVDIMRVFPPGPDFPAINRTAGSAKLTAATLNDGYFHPEAIELLGVVNHPEFTRLIQAALLTFRNLASITGGWHHGNHANPFSSKYGLAVDNDKRRLRIERAPEPYVCLRESLDDLVRLVIAEKAGVQPCFAEHPKHKDSTGAPDCWDPGIGFAGAYRKLHNEQELRQVRLPAMTLKEKMTVVAEELPGLESLLSSATDDGIQSEIRRLQQKGILPAIGTPRQSELEQILKQPRCVGARILNKRGLAVAPVDHEGRIFYRMAPKRKRQRTEPDNDACRHNTGPVPKRQRKSSKRTTAVIIP